MQKQITTTETQISINISTGCLHDEGNRFEEARQQIERSAFYLQSIFNLMRRSARQLEESSDSKIQEIGTDFMNFCEIGYGISETVFLSLKVFYDVEQKKREEVRGESEVN